MAHAAFHGLGRQWLWRWLWNRPRGTPWFRLCSCLCLGFCDCSLHPFDKSFLVAFISDSSTACCGEGSFRREFNKELCGRPCCPFDMTFSCPPQAYTTYGPLIKRSPPVLLHLACLYRARFRIGPCVGRKRALNHWQHVLRGLAGKGTSRCLSGISYYLFQQTESI